MKIFCLKSIAVFIIFCASLLLPETAHGSAWKLSRNLWSEEDERVYGDFVEKLCDSKHSNLNRFIRDAKANPLYGAEDKNFNLSPDCADLPYLIRAYVAYKLRLPFSYASAISSRGRDQRYGLGNRPTAFKDQDYFSSPQKLFSQVLLVNTGYFRTAPEVENSDFYPVKINRKSIRPGTIYYDPDGHVAIVAKVTDDGRIRVIDGHPDRTISKPWFGSKFTRGSRANGGGFKLWRPIRYTSEGKIIRTTNHNLMDFSAEDQYQKTFAFNGQKGLSYHDYVRKSLAKAGQKTDPLSEFVFMMHDLHEDISYRAIAVNLAVSKGISKKPHPGALPWNIYGTDGVWEDYSTPSRDARLKVSFREFYDHTRIMVMSAQQAFGPAVGHNLAQQFLKRYDELAEILTVSYVNSSGQRILLNFNDVCQRLFELSFDPYHSIEYRWGATGQELASANDGPTKKRFYDLERRLRNQLERVYNQATPLSMGPDRPPDVDVRSWLIAYLQGHAVDSKIVEIAKETIAPASHPLVLAKVSAPAAPAAPAPIPAPVTAPAPAALMPPKAAVDVLSEALEFGEYLAAAFADGNNYSQPAE